MMLGVLSHDHVLSGFSKNSREGDMLPVHLRVHVIGRLSTDATLVGHSGRHICIA